MKQFSCLLCLLIIFPLSANARSYDQHLLSVRFVDEYGKVFKSYPLNHINTKFSHDIRSYLEAVRDKNYEIEIVNHSHKRLGLVIAVDGRNIISGKPSELEASERMYIVDPKGRQRYSGWRTDRDSVHRFYFTEAEESYSAAFSDYSAMGVVAVVVFEEKPSLILKEKKLRDKVLRQKKHHSNSAEVLSKSDTAEAEIQAGTGFGEELYSRVQVVRFNPETKPAQRYFFKYEWRQSLCRKGIIDCEENRFWPEQYGYVPYPPGYDR